MSDTDDAPTEEPSASSVGNHTDGVTVADLIAKLNGDEAVPAELKRDRPDLSTPPAEPPPSPPTEVIDAVPAYGRHELPLGPDIEPHEAAAEVPEAEDYYDTEIIPAVAMDLPDLTSTHRHGRVPPSHVGAGRRRTDEHQPSRGRHRSMVVGRVVTALIAVLALALTGGAWQWQSAKNNMLNRISALDPDSRDILDPNAQFGDENFLIVGVDSRMGENVDMGAGTTDEAAGARSDTVMLVNIPANRERVVAVSFPRDLAIEPMQCEPWDPKTGEYGPITDPESPMYGADRVYTEYKLNSAYAVGGPKCLVKVIQKLSGLYVNRFMAVDFAGFSKMVDALGGVEVCSTTPLEDYELGTVLANAGRQTVDGHTALQYVRARQVTTETNGDYGRIKRQQLFLSSLLRSMISKEVFFSLNKLNNVVNMFINDSYVDNMNTKDLVTLGQSVQGIAAGRITFLTVPTTGFMDEYGNEHLREEDNGPSSTRSSTTIRCQRRRTPTTPRCPALPKARPRHPVRTPRHRPSSSTRSRPTRTTSPCRCRIRRAKTGWVRPPPANSKRMASTSSRPTITQVRWTPRRCFSPRATSRRPQPLPRRSPTRPSNARPTSATSFRWYSATTSTR